MGTEPALFGTDLFGEVVNPAKDTLRNRFIAPPFSILDARSGDWQTRKRAWEALGIKSEIGRGKVQPTLGNARQFQKETAANAGDDVTVEEWASSSIFDPVICECAYRWWCPDGGQVLDPFAGGSVRGIVAGALGRSYWGCDLRAEQIAANNVQADEIGVVPRPTWVCGDSRETLATAPEADFIFSCPPYGDLEKYSDDPRDISSYSFKAFVDAYQEIIAAACRRLRQDRFACFVVGDFRDKVTGIYRNFPLGTIRSFQKAGLKLYNEAILVTPTGTAPIRATRQFSAGRKLVKGHQNLLLFVKGEWRGAVDYLKQSMREEDELR